MFLPFSDHSQGFSYISFVISHTFQGKFWNIEIWLDSRLIHNTKSLATRKIPPQFSVTKCWASALVDKVWVKKTFHLSIAVSKLDYYCCLDSKHVHKQLIDRGGRSNNWLSTFEANGLRRYFPNKGGAILVLQ